MKVFGSYGVFYDTMKLNLAISSFGGQYWQNCTYALNTPDLGSINVAYNSANRYCAGNSATSQANFAGGSTPSGLTFIENVNNRAFPTTCPTCSSTQEGVAPNLKPYRQHGSCCQRDYAAHHSTLTRFEARYDRRRLDNVIEDSSIYNPSVGETFVVVNPGQGVNGTFSSFCNFLYPTSAGFTQCISQTNPPNQTIPAARSYDGLELRLNKAVSNHWLGMFSYTYSHFRGNYTGLTSSDLADGGYGGRNAPNNSRAFDEPYFSYNSMGGSSSGLLPTDRPNALKGYAYYQLGFLKKFTTDFGIFQTVYQGTPNSTYIQGVGLPAAYDFPVYVFNRGKWADVSQDPNTGAITLGNPRTYRNPWYIQSDFNIQQSYKIGEAKAVSVGATFTNLFDQRAVTAGESTNSSTRTPTISTRLSSSASEDSRLPMAFRSYRRRASVQRLGALLNSIRPRSMGGPSRRSIASMASRCTHISGPYYPVCRRVHLNFQLAVAGSSFTSKCVPGSLPDSSPIAVLHSKVDFFHNALWAFPTALFLI